MGWRPDAVQHLTAAITAATGEPPFAGSVTNEEDRLVLPKSRATAWLQIGADGVETFGGVAAVSKTFSVDIIEPDQDGIEKTDEAISRFLNQEWEMLRMIPDPDQQLCPLPLDAPKPDEKTAPKVLRELEAAICDGLSALPRDLLEFPFDVEDLADDVTAESDNPARGQALAIHPGQIAGADGSPERRLIGIQRLAPGPFHVNGKITREKGRFHEKGERSFRILVRDPLPAQVPETDQITYRRETNDERIHGGAEWPECLDLPGIGRIVVKSTELGIWNLFDTEDRPAALPESLRPPLPGDNRALCLPERRQDRQRHRFRAGPPGPDKTVRIGDMPAPNQIRVAPAILGEGDLYLVTFIHPAPVAFLSPRPAGARRATVLTAFDRPEPLADLTVRTLTVRVRI